jgi:hypothetical protein
MFEKNVLIFAVAQLKQQLSEAKENAAQSLKNSAGVIDK